MPVDAELQPILDLVNAVAAPPPSLDRVAELRESFALLVAAFGPGPDDVEVEGVAVPNGASPLGLRIYRSTAPDAPRRPGALVWFHGGGWVIGDVDTHDALCRELCARSAATVISVDYRLAPEHRFPAAHDDARRALRWIAAHAVELEIDPSRLAVGGDSAGGHLATVAALRARTDGPDLRAQVLVYPVTDLAATPERYPSLRDNAEGYLLTAETMQFFSDTYAPDVARRVEPDASPVRVEDLSGSPTTLLITAEFDPLRDEGAHYAARLAAAGVDTRHEDHAGATHLFVQMTSTALAQRALDQIVDVLRSTGVA